MVAKKKRTDHTQQYKEQLILVHPYKDDCEMRLYFKGEIVGSYYWETWLRADPTSPWLRVESKEITSAKSLAMIEELVRAQYDLIFHAGLGIPN